MPEKTKTWRYWAWIQEKGNDPAWFIMERDITCDSSERAEDQICRRVEEWIRKEQLLGTFGTKRRQVCVWISMESVKERVPWTFSMWYPVGGELDGR